MGLSVSILLWAVLGMVAAATLLVWGWRGRSIGDEPHCRTCGFNLVGSLPAAATCPECGAGLGGRYSVQRGQRRRHGGLMIAGLCIGLLTAGVIGLGLSRSASWSGMPTYLLRWVYPVDATARQVLADRILTLNVSQAVVDVVTSRALSVQADSTQAWDATWGRLVECAWDAGQLSQVDAERYLKHAVAFTLQVEALDAETCGLSLHLQVARAGDFGFGGFYRWSEVSVNGQPDQGTLHMPRDTRINMTAHTFRAESTPTGSLSSTTTSIPHVSRYALPTDHADDPRSVQVVVAVDLMQTASSRPVRLKPRMRAQWDMALGPVIATKPSPVTPQTR